MIRYALQCQDGHRFDGWFRSSDGYEAMQAAGQVACTICGSTRIDKSMMAPSVPNDRGTAKAAGTGPLETASDEREQVLRKLRDHVEANSDYVGMRFADEARAMHEGRSESRSIHGEARPEEARKLLEDGVPVAPLPFIPRQKAN